MKPDQVGLLGHGEEHNPNKTYKGVAMFFIKTEILALLGAGVKDFEKSHRLHYGFFVSGNGQSRFSTPGMFPGHGEDVALPVSRLRQR